MAGLESRTRCGPLDVAWQVDPCVLLRATAFAWSLLDGFPSPEAAGWAERVHACRELLDGSRQRFAARDWPEGLRRAEARYPHRHAAFKELFRLRRAVQRGVEPPPGAAAAWRELGAAGIEDYESALLELLNTRKHARAAWEHALAGARRHLHEVLGSERVQEAIFLSSPGFFDHGLSSLLRAGPDAARNARLRAHEAVAHRYVQRLCSRCETTSFFGPVLYATLDAEADVAVHTVAPGREEVVIDASAWVVAGLAELLAPDLDVSLLRPRMNPLFALSAHGTVTRCLDGRRARPAPEVLALWRELDGERSLAEAAGRAGIDLSRLPDVLAAAGNLVVGAVEVPAAAPAQLEQLADQDRDGGPARRLLAVARTFASTPWPARRAVLAEAERLCEGLGLAARRGAGRQYADRTVLREDRASPLNLKVTLGAPVVAGFRSAITDVLELCLLAALLRREDARDAVRRALGGQARPLCELASAELVDDAVRTRELDRVLADLPGLRGAPAGGEVSVTSGQLSAVLEPLWDLVPLDEDLSCLPGFDLLAAGVSLQDARWVLGELHDDSSSVHGGFTAALHPDAAGLWADFERRLVRLVDPDRMATIVSRRRTKHITPEPPGLSIELTGRSCKPRSQTAPIAEVQVHPSGHCLVHEGRHMLLYPGDLSSTLHRALALPALTPVSIGAGVHTPRLVVGSTVYQRARWRLPLEPPNDAYEWWTTVAGMRRRHRLPRHVFVRHPDEPKPLHLDLADPLGVEALRRLSPAAIEVTEMLPAPGELWWAPEGDPECAELRVGCLMRASIGRQQP